MIRKVLTLQLKGGCLTPWRKRKGEAMIVRRFHRKEEEWCWGVGGTHLRGSRLGGKRQVKICSLRRGKKKVLSVGKHIT